MSMSLFVMNPEEIHRLIGEICHLERPLLVWPPHMRSHPSLIPSAYNEINSCTIHVTRGDRSYQGKAQWAPRLAFFTNISTYIYTVISRQLDFPRARQVVVRKTFLELEDDAPQLMFVDTSTSISFSPFHCFSRPWSRNQFWIHNCSWAPLLINSLPAPIGMSTHQRDLDQAQPRAAALRSVCWNGCWIWMDVLSHSNLSMFIAIPIFPYTLSCSDWFKRMEFGWFWGEVLFAFFNLSRVSGLTGADSMNSNTNNRWTEDSVFSISGSRRSGTGDPEGGSHMCVLLGFQRFPSCHSSPSSAYELAGWMSQKTLTLGHLNNVVGVAG